LISKNQSFDIYTPLKMLYYSITRVSHDFRRPTAKISVMLNCASIMIAIILSVSTIMNR